MSARRRLAGPGLSPMRIRLTLDDGLAAYVRAIVKGIGIYGGERDTIAYLLRSSLREYTTSEVFLGMMLPHLPPTIQRAWRQTAKGKAAWKNRPRRRAAA